MKFVSKKINTNKKFRFALLIIIININCNTVEINIENQKSLIYSNGEKHFFLHQISDSLFFFRIFTTTSDTKKAKEKNFCGVVVKTDDHNFKILSSSQYPYYYVNMTKNADTILINQQPALLPFILEDYIGMKFGLYKKSEPKNITQVIYDNSNDVDTVKKSGIVTFYDFPNKNAGKKNVQLSANDMFIYIEGVGGLLINNNRDLQCEGDLRYAHYVNEHDTSLNGWIKYPQSESIFK